VNAGKVVKSLAKKGHGDLAAEVIANAPSDATIRKITDRARELQSDSVYYAFHLTEAINKIASEFDLTGDAVRPAVEGVYYERRKNETREYDQLKDPIE